MADIIFANNSCRDSGGGWSHAVWPDTGSSLHIRMATSPATVGRISILNNTFSQDVPFAGGFWMWDSPWASSRDSHPNVAWGRNLTTDHNRWCLHNASLGPLIVWGLPLDNNFTRIDASAEDFRRYRALTGNGGHSTLQVGEGPCG